MNTIFPQKPKLFLTALILLLLAGLFSFRRTENFGSVLNGYKPDELRYFSEVAFLSGKLRRWHSPIYISLNNYTGKDKAYIERLVRQLEPLLTVPVSYIPTGGNFTVHYTETLKEYSRHYTGEENLPLGYAIPTFSDNNALIHADIYLHPSLLDEKKDEVLLHEICHALGLLDHPSSPFTDANVMGAATYRNRNTIAAIPRLDQAALKLLYDKRMPKGLLREDFLKRLPVVSMQNY